MTISSVKNLTINSEKTRVNESFVWVTLKDVKLFIVNRQNVSEIFVNIHNVNLFNVKPKELSKAGLYVCKGTKQ